MRIHVRLTFVASVSSQSRGTGHSVLEPLVVGDREADVALVERLGPFLVELALRTAVDRCGRHFLRRLRRLCRLNPSGLC